jgi:hypothetical protein
MQNASCRRTVFLVLLLTVLAVPWASAAPRLDADRPAAASALGLLDRVWAFLKSAWSETGCHLDPDGRCAPAPQPQTDEGCRLDPNGGCGA